MVLKGVCPVPPSQKKKKTCPLFLVRSLDSNSLGNDVFLTQQKIGSAIQSKGSFRGSRRFSGLSTYSFLKPYNLREVPQKRSSRLTRKGVQRACADRGRRSLGSTELQDPIDRLFCEDAPLFGLVCKGNQRKHRCPFWLIWLKNGGPWFTWWFNQPPGSSIFQKKDTYEGKPLPDDTQSIPVQF